MNSYPWDVRLKKNRNEPVVELAVRYSVPTSRPSSPQ